MNNLETRVLEIIGEDTESPDVFLDTDAGMAPIRDSLNDAIQEIVSLTGSKTRNYFLPLRQEQSFYRLSINDGYLGWVTDAWSINQGQRLEQTDLLKLNNYDPRWLVTNGEPRAYFQVGTDVVGVWPKPATDSNTLELTIVEIPRAYETDTDRVNLREEFTYAAVNYAVSEYWASRGDAQQAQVFMKYYMDAVGLRDQFMGRDHTYQLKSTKESPTETG